MTRNRVWPRWLSLSPGNLDSMLAGRWTRLLVAIPFESLVYRSDCVAVHEHGARTGWQSLLVDADVGWHIRTGRTILDQHSVRGRICIHFQNRAPPWYAGSGSPTFSTPCLFRMAGLKAWCSPRVY